jgi:hypothetical protein
VPLKVNTVQDTSYPKQQFLLFTSVTTGECQDNTSIGLHLFPSKPLLIHKLTNWHMVQILTALQNNLPKGKSERERKKEEKDHSLAIHYKNISFKTWRECCFTSFDPNHHSPRTVFGSSNGMTTFLLRYCVLSMNFPTWRCLRISRVIISVSVVTWCLPSFDGGFT